MTTETPTRGTRWDWGLAAVAAVALGFRLPYLTERSLWYDESSSWQTAKFSFPEMLRSVRLNVHLPLYYTLLKGWMAVWGESVASIRGFSISFGVLTVVAMGVFAGELYRASAVGDDGESDRRRFARVVAMLVAMSPYQAFLSLEARMYSLGTTFAAVGAWLLLRVLRDPARAAVVGVRGGLRRDALHAPLRPVHRRLVVCLPGAVCGPAHGGGGSGRGPGGRRRAAGAGAVVAAVYLPGMALLRAQVHRVQQDYSIPR